MFALIRGNRAFSLVLAVILCGLLFQGILQAAYNPGDNINDFTLRDFTGQEVSLYDYAGYAVVVNFYAPW